MLLTHCPQSLLPGHGFLHSWHLGSSLSASAPEHEAGKELARSRASVYRTFHANRGQQRAWGADLSVFCYLCVWLLGHSAFAQCFFSTHAAKQGLSLGVLGRPSYPYDGRLTKVPWRGTQCSARILNTFSWWKLPRIGEVTMAPSPRAAPSAQLQPVDVTP